MPPGVFFICHTFCMGRNNEDFETGHGLTPEQATSYAPNELDITQDFQGGKTSAGMVPLSVVGRYQEFDREKENPERITRLAKDIAENGIRTPLELRYDHERGWGTLVEGNHRLAAARRLGLTHVPVVVTSGMGHSDGAPLTLRENMAVTPPAWMTHRQFPYFRQAHPSAFQELAGQ